MELLSMEISAGMVLFRKDNKKIFYLLLHYENRETGKKHWDFPKGHIKKRETLEKTALMELKEETGIKGPRFVKGFKETINYFFKKGGKLISKKVIFFLAESDQEHVKLSFEHIGYKWLPYEEAVEQVTFKNAKQVLEKANKALLE
ncbi:MAG: NUDIX domain-containing protein [Candidatus Aenigmarchaeota archaeon]|nr:NUDIX domain-containing protein [Candidatus Aenigmarchaeota archaeon]